MDFDIKCNDYKLLVNSREVVDLSKGFGGIHDLRIRKSSKDADNMDPAKLANGPRYKRYFVKIDEHRYYKMKISYEHNLRSQIIYSTRENISELFKSKALNFILHNLSHDNGDFKAIRRALSTTINLISNSYAFDEIVTDIPSVTTLKLNLPIKLIDASLVKPNEVYESQLNLLIKKYKKVPFRVLPPEVLTRLQMDDTTLPELRDQIQGRVLLISGINKSSCGLISRELSNSTNLPVTLFNLASS